jgi:probable F420-dependent oxidoreductase
MGFQTVYRASRVPMAKMAEVARRAEEVGYDTIGIQEATHDSFLGSVKAIDGSSKIRVDTRLTICFPRSPMVTAMAAWDLQEYSKGRFQLGIGTQVKGHMIRRYSVPWFSPGPRFKEYIESVRAIWDTFQNGKELDYQGEHYQFSLMTPYFNPGPIPYSLPGLAIGAVGPYNCRLAGKLCDSLLLHLMHSPEYVGNFVIPHVEEGARKMGRDPKKITISGGGFVGTGANKQEVKQMREVVRQRVAYHASARTYHHILSATGHEGAISKLHELSVQGKWDELARHVTDEMVDALTVVGEYDEIAPIFKERYGGLLDEVAPEFNTPGPMPMEIEKRIIRELKEG